MQCLWIKPVGKGDYLICLDCDSTKAVHVAFNIILEVAIGDRTQKWHSSISKRTTVSCQAYWRWSNSSSSLLKNPRHGERVVIQFSVTNRRRLACGAHL